MATKPKYVGVTPYSELKAWRPADRVKCFADCATSGQRAFAVMGKLIRLIEADAEKQGNKLFPYMKEQGVPRHTVGNATYAAKVYDHVTENGFTEAMYDRLAFQDCLAIVRVTSKGSKARLTIEDVVRYMDLDPVDFAEDFMSLYRVGKTVAEVKAEFDAEEARKAKAEKDLLAAEAEAARLAEEKRLADEEEAARIAANPPAPKAPVAEPPPVADAPAANATPPPPAPPVSSNAPATPAPPNKVIVQSGIAPTPPEKVAAKKPTPADAVALLETLKLMLCEFSDYEAKPVIEKLCELADTAMALTADAATRELKAA